MGPQVQTPVFCISLKVSQRRHSFAAVASRSNVSFEFFDAVTIDDVRTGLSVPGCHLDMSDLRWTWHERHDPRRQHGPILFAEIACAYSHLKCRQAAAKMDADYVVVFEDDSIIVNPLASIHIPTGTDILYLSNRMPYNERGEAFGYGCGTEGYLLTRSGIAKCLQIFSILYMPVDLQLIAHQLSQINLAGNSICQFRRLLPQDAYLRAYESDVRYCVYSQDNSSHILSS